MNMFYEQFKDNVFLVDMKQDLDAGVFSALAKKTLENYIQQGKKLLIIGGKDGVSTGGQCKDCGHVPMCTHCDIPIAYHRDQAGQMFGLCHICKKSYPPLISCANCGSYEVDFFGTGLQKLQELVQKYAESNVYTTTTLAANDLASLPKISRTKQVLQDVKCVIASSILQIAPSDWEPDAVIVVRADSALSIPDWKVAEHCYNMLSMIISQYSCPIILQAYNATHHAILAACKQDEQFFWQHENTFREQYMYPPYGELAMLLYKHEIEETMFTRVHKLYQELLYLQQQELFDGKKFDGEIFATPPLVYKMFDKYRYNIVIKGEQIRPFLEYAFVKLKIRDRGFKIDWLPENIT